MFSVKEKQHIAAEVEKLLLALKHPEMPTEKPMFELHVKGKEDWSWADIRPNHTFSEANPPGINPWNEHARDAMPFPPRYRKKPVVVSATQWHKNGDHPDDHVMRPFEDTGKTPEVPREGAVVRYYRHPEVSGAAICKHCRFTFHYHGFIDTLEGGHIVCPGDWIITGVKGERYPCKPDIFAATYEPA